MNAKIEETSQVSRNGGVSSESVSDRLEPDHRKIPVWVPKPASYGGENSNAQDMDESTLIVGFDTEYKPQQDRNLLVSYQFDARHASGRSWTGVIYPKPGKRIKLTRFLSQVLDEGKLRGMFSRWPKRIYLVGHFTIADIPAFADFKTLKTQFDALRRTFVTVSDGQKLKLHDKDRHSHKITVTLRDTMLLAPGGCQKLKDLGEMVGKPKLELTSDEIKNMDRLLIENRSRFEEYALRDAEICADYALEMVRLNREINGEAALPVTLSSIGLDFLLNKWKADGIDKLRVMGTEMIDSEEWSSKLKRYIKKLLEVPIVERHRHENFVNECYHGGRNEQYIFGAGEPGDWTDYDLCGAYTTAMALIQTPLWTEVRLARHLDEFKPEVMGYAHVRFQFPDGTRFPCLPVRPPSGIVFPLKGESYCCAPEIHLATTMGAHLELVYGVILPTTEGRPFEKFISECAARRKNYKQVSVLKELFWKELGNGTYGKTAQGLRKKRCFDSRKGIYRDMPESRITNPYFAAYVTSFVRAVLGELLFKLPAHAAVCNATTDGFLSTATQDEVLAAASGPLCSLFAEARCLVAGTREVVDVKHRIRQPLGWRTRGQATLVAMPGEKIVLAKAGLKPPVDGPPGELNHLQNEWVVDQFLNRTGETRYNLEMLRSLPEIWRNDGDLVADEHSRALSMEYDWKRCPANPGVRPIRGTQHLCFETKPWLSVLDFQKCRDDWERFNQPREVLKTAEDLQNFEEHRSLELSATSLKKPKKGAALKHAQKMFRYAYVRSMCGLDATAMQYPEVAQWLTESGYPTKRDDLENANRATAKLATHSVQSTTDVLKFFELVRSRFPGFDANILLTQ